MNLRQQLMPVVIALAAVFALGYGLLLFISALIDKLNTISGDLSKALVAGGITIVTAVLTLVIGKIWEQKLKIRQEIRENGQFWWLFSPPPKGAVDPLLTPASTRYNLQEEPSGAPTTRRGSVQRGFTLRGSVQRGFAGHRCATTR